ncbi:MAG: hypothetical protein LUH41_00820 [Clostridiales bacterium]|nr:hypothetical protein [Clostridiales bacterium]
MKRLKALNKRLALRGVIFCLILVLLLNLLWAVFRPKNNTQAAGQYYADAHGFLAEPEDSIDVFFLGDSMTYSAYTPMEMWEEQGFTSYVCAIGSGRMNYAYELLCEIVECQSPRVVVIEAHVATRATPAKLAELTEATLWFPIFRYHDRWKSLTLNDFTSPVEYTNRKTDKGFRMNHKVGAADAEGYMEETEESADVALISRFYLLRCKALCEANGIDLIVVATPSTVNWDYQKHNAMEQMAQSYGIDFLDLDLLTDEIGIDWGTDSRDGGDHLNYNGASKVSAYISGYLADRYDLPDHREDGAYAAWNDDLEAYRKELEG